MAFEACRGRCPTPSLAGQRDAAFRGELMERIRLVQTPRSDASVQRRHGGSPGTRRAAPAPAVPAAPCSRACPLTAFTAAFPQKLSPGSLPQRAYLLPPGFAAKRLLLRAVFILQLAGTWPCFGAGAGCQNPPKGGAGWRGDVGCPPRRAPRGCPRASRRAAERGPRAGGRAGDSTAASPRPMKAERLLCKLPASVSSLN